MKKDLEQFVIDKYKLTDEQYENTKQTIINTLAYNKHPSENPLLVVVGGQSGAGKSALINYTTEMSSQRNFVIIDNDNFRSFHPFDDEIKKSYPDLYTAATDQLGLGVTADVIAYFMENKYDIIFHQTLKNNRIADDAITKFRNAEYTVCVRAFAVPYIESKMSQIERCLTQIDKLGYCRYVRKTDHDAAVKGLPETIDYIEKTGKYDSLEIYKRSKDISKPTLVYSRINPETEETTIKTLSNCEQVLLEDEKFGFEDEKFGFEDAKDAVVRTREQDETKLMNKVIDQRIENAENHPCNNPDMQVHIDELKDYVENFRETQLKKTSSAISETTNFQ